MRAQGCNFVVFPVHSCSRSCIKQAWSGVISGYRPGQLYQHPEYEHVGGAPQAETAEVVLGSIRARVDLTTTEQGESFYGSLARRCALLELVLSQAAYGRGKTVDVVRSTLPCTVCGHCLKYHQALQRSQEMS